MSDRCDDSKTNDDESDSDNRGHFWRPILGELKALVCTHLCNRSFSQSMPHLQQGKLLLHNAIIPPVQYMHIYTGTHTHIYIYIHTHIHIYICTPTHTLSVSLFHTHKHSLCVSVSVSVCLSLSHTHTHTLTHS